MTVVAALVIGLAATIVVGPRPAVARLRRILGTGRWDGSGSERGQSSHGSKDGDDGEGRLSGRRARQLASAFAGVAVALFVPFPMAVVAIPVVAAGAWWVLGRAEPAARARKRRQLAIELPLAAELLAAALSAGCSIAGAVDVVGHALDGPLGRALRRCAASAAVGVRPEQMWAALRDEDGLVSLARVLDAAIVRGTSPVPALHRIAEDARLAARWSAQGRARALGARAAAPLGLCFLPAFVLLAVVPLVATSGSDLF